MLVRYSSEIPDRTYFRLSQVEPTISNNKLIVYQGKGTRRGWGVPSVAASVIVNTRTFTAVHVGFHHKHRGGQGWFYYVNGERKIWSQLTAYRRQQVLKNLKQAPGWAKYPGKAK